MIIDDEPLAGQLLSSYVEKTPFLHLIGSYNSAVAAIKDLRENRVHLVFLDIQMPELSGIEFATIIPKSTRIIFTTAFSQYAVDGKQGIGMVSISVFFKRHHFRPFHLREE